MRRGVSGFRVAKHLHLPVAHDKQAETAGRERDDAHIGERTERFWDGLIRRRVVLLSTAGDFNALLNALRAAGLMAGFTPSPKVPVKSISISPSSPTVKEHGTLRLSATVKPDNATDRTVSWSSGDKLTATVTSDGTVTGIKQGTTSITATANDGSKVSSTVTLTVTAKPTGQGPLALFGDSQLIVDSDTSLTNMGPYPSGANPGTATSWPSDQSKQIASITGLRVIDLYYGGARIARDKTGWQGGWAMQSNTGLSRVRPPLRRAVN